VAILDTIQLNVEFLLQNQQLASQTILTVVILIVESEFNYYIISYSILLYNIIYYIILSNIIYYIIYHMMLRV